MITGMEGLERALDVPDHKMHDEAFLRASVINARAFFNLLKEERIEAMIAVPSEVADIDPSMLPTTRPT